MSLFPPVVPAPHFEVHWFKLSVTSLSHGQLQDSVCHKRKVTEGHDLTVSVALSWEKTSTEHPAVQSKSEAFVCIYFL